MPRNDHYQTRGDHGFNWNNGGNLKEYRGDYNGKNIVDKVSLPQPLRSSAVGRYQASGCGRDQHIHTCSAQEKRAMGYGSSHINFAEDLRGYNTIGVVTEPLPGMSSKKYTRTGGGGLHSLGFAVPKKRKNAAKNGATNIQGSPVQHAGEPRPKGQSFNWPPLHQYPKMNRKRDRSMDAYDGPGRLSDVARSPERSAKVGGKLGMQTLKAATKNAKDSLNIEVEKLQKEAERLRFNLQRIGGEADNDQVETISLKEEIKTMKDEKRRMLHLLESMAPAKKGGVSGF
jgi:hypothetical protein